MFWFESRHQHLAREQGGVWTLAECQGPGGSSLPGALALVSSHPQSAPSAQTQPECCGLNVSPKCTC